nr:MAG TPA: Protein of unknown function (DUF3489) [Caudoviricetes sp.]
MTLGFFLKKDREDKCLTQEEYSKAIGISRSTLAYDIRIFFKKR